MEDLNIANCVFNVFSSYTAIMLNILTIHAMRKTSSLPKPLKTLLLSLAVSDLGVGLLVQPLYIAVMVRPTYFTDTALSIIALLFLYSAFFSVVTISVDRFLAIHLHLRYQELVTHKRVVAVVISIWILSTFLSFSELWVGEDDITNLGMFITIIVGLCFIFYNSSLLQNLFHCATPHKPNSRWQMMRGRENLPYILCFWFVICQSIVLQLFISSLHQQPPL